MKYSQLILATALGTLGMTAAHAAPTAAEVAELGKSLTPFGAIKAGNKEGTIPEWTGGVCKPPAGYKPLKGLEVGGGPYVDPFASDKLLFKITAENVAQYADKLDDGVKALFKRYPKTYYIKVYPTRRSACFADWVYNNTVKKVMNPKIVGGNIPALTGAHAQIPFPTPKTGVEAMWNSLVKVDQPNVQFNISSYLIDSSGNSILTVTQMVYMQKPYWDNKLSAVPEDKPYWTLRTKSSEPVSQVGGMTMLHKYLRPDLKGDPAWSYIPGQRRVRLAPEFSYDGVSVTSGGMLLYDEINGFDGKMDRFDFKLIGRKEMYVPYNAYEFLNSTLEKLHTPEHLEPSVVRYELHRVWVVEATLKPGERHVQSKKVFYIDEDSWNILAFVGYDQSNKVNHLIHWPTTQAYDKPELRLQDYMLYDLSKRAYVHNAAFAREGKGNDYYGVMNVKTYPKNFFTPDSMAGGGVR